MAKITFTGEIYNEIDGNSMEIFEFEYEIEEPPGSTKEDVLRLAGD